MNLQKLAIVTFLALAIGSFIYFDVGSLLTLSNIKANQHELAQLYQQYPIQSLLLFFCAFSLYASLPMPGLIIWTL